MLLHINRNLALLFSLISLVFTLSIPGYAEGKYRVVKSENSVLLSSNLTIMTFSEPDFPSNALEISSQDRTEEKEKITLEVQETESTNARVVLPEPRLIKREMAIEDWFMRGYIQGLIAWNGKTDNEGEEILIVSALEKSDTDETEATLGIIPLPGKPIAIKRMESEVLLRSKTIVEEKIFEKVKSQGIAIGGVPMKSLQAISCFVFVLEFENMDFFKEDINCCVKNLYGSDVEVILTVKDREIINSYWENGFRFFAFDLSSLNSRPQETKPLMFHFKSSFVYFPLAIDACGSKGHGLIDLIVITPDVINLCSIDEGKEETRIIVKGNTFITMDLSELLAIDSVFADFFLQNDLNHVKARNFLIETDDIGNFKNDFIAYLSPITEYESSHYDENEADVPHDEKLPPKDFQNHDVKEISQ